MSNVVGESNLEGNIMKQTINIIDGSGSPISQFESDVVPRIGEWIALSDSAFTGYYEVKNVLHTYFFEGESAASSLDVAEVDIWLDKVDDNKISRYL